jgi:hypothetical protein
MYVTLFGLIPSKITSALSDKVALAKHRQSNAADGTNRSSLTQNPCSI